MKSPKGTLYLIPSLLGETETNRVLPDYNLHLIQNINVFIVEELRTARRFLRKCGYSGNFEEVTFHILNEHTSAFELEEFTKELLAGRNAGLISEAGCPSVADPGSALVKIAHYHKISIVPLSGPSSLMLALMASGMNGQQFTFHGYLPAKQEEREKKIKEIEKASLRSGSTHLFIEAPYRNNHLLDSLLKICNGATLLCLACNISLPDEYIFTTTITEWRNMNFKLDKRPTVYLISS